MLKKLKFASGINQENTSYSLEGGWYFCDKIRFRQGTPQKIGGWSRLSSYTYKGICRSINTWQALSGVNYIGLGTTTNFYIANLGLYYDITPIRKVQDLPNALSIVAVGSPKVNVAAIAHGCVTGDTVTFNGAVSLGGAITSTVLNRSFTVTVTSVNAFTITTSANANSSDTTFGGTAVHAVYLNNIGSDSQTPIGGWGSGTWGSGTWGIGTVSIAAIRLWSQSNYGQDLIYGYRGGAIYYWYASRGTTPKTLTSVSIATPCVISMSPATILSDGSPIQLSTDGTLPTGLSAGTTYYLRGYSTTTGLGNLSLTPTGALINTTGVSVGTHSIEIRGVNLTTIVGASDVPTIQNYLYISDIYRFVFAFGCNDYGQTDQDPMLIRWSDQENAANWTPATTNQAGSLRLTRGSKIITCRQTRQEIVVWTDSSLYSLQYLGYPLVWGAQLVGDNISIVSQNCVVAASGIVYWMGRDKFYFYDGHTQTLDCNLRQHVFLGINPSQYAQCFAGTNEGYNEVWWFYCSSNSIAVDSYVIYNYVEKIWYYGTMARTAWLDSGILQYPIAATYSYNLVNHENGVDDGEGATPIAIESYAESSQVDVDDGDNFIFIRRILPDFGFDGSTNTTPSLTFTLHPMTSSGSGYKSPASLGGSDSGSVVRGSTMPIETFTEIIYPRVRGRQFTFKIYNNQLGVQWQFGAPRVDFVVDGQRG